MACVLRALVYPKKTPVDHDAHWTKCACRRGDATSCVVHTKRSVKTCVCDSNAVSKQSRTKSRPDGVGGAMTDDVMRTSASGDSCQSSCAVCPTPSSDSLSRVYAVEDFHVPPSSAETPVAAAALDDRTSAEASGDAMSSGISDQSTELLTAAHCPDGAGDNATVVSDNATPTSDSSTAASDSVTEASDSATTASDSATAADQPTTTAAAAVPVRANTRPASYWHVPPKCIFRPMTEVTTALGFRGHLAPLDRTFASSRRCSSLPFNCDLTFTRLKHFKYVYM